MKNKGIPKFGVSWDEKRNTSRTFRPGADAVTTALRATQRLRETDPALVRWIEEGHPRLTEEEYRERFGHEYKKTRPTKK